MANQMPPLLQQLTQSPLLLDGMAKEVLLGTVSYISAHAHANELLAANMGEDEEFWPRSDDWRASLRPYNVKNGILQIPVMGVLLNRFGYQLGRWATGYTYIEKALARGLADGNVRGIAFIHDSPGGEVAGNFELGDKIFEARGKKPMRAFAMDSSYSASYSLSSAAGPLSVSRSGGVGSIGVVTAHVEYSELLKNEGIKVTFIFAGKHKVDGNPYEKLPESVKSRWQERIDTIYGVFTAAVARNRSMDEGKVRATEALTYEAKQAIDKGLADRVGSFEEEMALFSDEIDQGDENMAIEQAAHDAAVNSARTEGHAAGKAEGLKEGLTAARVRINAILALDEAKERPKAANSLAMKTDLSVEDAKASLADMAVEPKAEVKTPPKPKAGEPGAMFDAAMGNGAGVEAEGEGDDADDTDKAATGANAILGSYRRATGRPAKKAA